MWLRRYDAVSQRLGEEFKAELRQFINVAAAKPGRFHLIKPGFHRANLKRFPYHFIYRELPELFLSDFAGRGVYLLKASSKT